MRPGRAGLALVALLLGLAARHAPSQAPGTFPHQRHEGLFPTCVGCHRGIETGDTTAIFPTPATCRNCHDGQVRERVSWVPGRRAASNLHFSHVDHRRVSAAAGTPAECAACHLASDSAPRMAVSGPRPDRCIACHAHQAPTHLAPVAQCTRCHLPLTQARGLSREEVAAFPQPAWHQSADFIHQHGRADSTVLRSCAVCHARESCQRCHLNADRVTAIAALQPDTRIAALVAGRAPRYPAPDSHGKRQWQWQHGPTARAQPGECANCHARSSCQTCHRDGDLPELSALPRAVPGGPPGVQLSTRRSAVHPAGYIKAHGALAASSEETCASCHAQSFCIDCHAGPTTPGFHPANFLERHGPEAYGAETECSSCHTAETFCRSCHRATGLSSRGRTTVAFHNSQPQWLLGHGQAARQGLQGCITCHTQADCAQCHSAAGGWRINPHGPGFDPARMEPRNRLMCLMCHLSGIPSGGG